MDYPKFDTHILIVPDREGMEVYTEKLLIEKVIEDVKSYISISAKRKATKPFIISIWTIQMNNSKMLFRVRFL